MSFLSSPRPLSVSFRFRNSGKEYDSQAGSTTFFHKPRIIISLAKSWVFFRNHSWKGGHIMLRLKGIIMNLTCGDLSSHLSVSLCVKTSFPAG